MSKSNQETVVVLGINGHIGHHVARAFASAGYRVRGFGRSNRKPGAGVEFVVGDAEKVEDIRRAVEGAEIVVNALNLPYDKWDKGRAEALTERVLKAIEGQNSTLMFPGNIYNFSARSREILPDCLQNPETPRGAIRVRQELMLKKAAERGAAQVLILRAGDFYGPDSHSDWYDLLIMREVAKRRIAIPGNSKVGHAWAYLPDFARAFVRVAEKRKELDRFETFHFEGHYVTHGELASAIRRAAPVLVEVVPFPWGLMQAMGLVNGVMREVVKMRYLWENSMQLVDPRLREILGENFDTPFKEAVAATVVPFFSKGTERAAA